MVNTVNRMLPRHVLQTVQDLVKNSPVVLLEGPRAVGKSNILAELARSLGAQVLDLDDLATRNAVKADPDLAVIGSGPVCIDEYQKVPAVLDVIKAEMNKGSTPGRFILAGSTRHDALPLQSEALTGRMERVTIYPLSQGEIGGAVGTIVYTALFVPYKFVYNRTSKTVRNDYIERVCAGGFPLALRSTTERAQRSWFDNYVRLSLERDVLELSNLRQKDKLNDLLKRMVGQTGQLMNISSAGEPIGLTKPTAESYVALLEKLFLVYRLEAWGKTLYSRAIKTPKVHVLDSGIGARLLRLTPTKIVPQNPTAMTEYGHLLESFAVSELLRQASWGGNVADFGHFRTRDNEEVDLVIENDEGGIIGFEIKAGNSVKSDGLDGLRQLKKVTGSSFVGGIALYTGSRSYTYEPQIHVIPLDRIWTP
jgi:predicted AAA+ superfamily ATPase